MPSTDGSATVVEDNAVVSKGKWTRFLPEAFGIRENVQKSPFRWCVRESAMWGIATGTAMGLTREHSEKIIETMMKANDFQSHEEMPETVPADQDPFLKVMDHDNEGMQKEFIARLKEKKEWEKPDDKVIESFKDTKRK